MAVQWYKLNQNKEIEPCTLEDADVTGNDRILIQSNVKDIFISTVFLHLDYSSGVGNPVLFETMIDGRGSEQEMERYCTYDEAMKGHWKHVGRAMLCVITGEWKPY